MTRFFADTNDDEFFWDTSGTGWAQLVRFGVGARAHPDGTRGPLMFQNACYQGYEGSTTTCEIARTDRRMAWCCQRTSKPRATRT